MTLPSVEEFLKKWEADYGNGVIKMREEMRKDLSALVAGAKAEALRDAASRIESVCRGDNWWPKDAVDAIRKRADEIEKESTDGR